MVTAYGASVPEENQMVRDNTAKLANKWKRNGQARTRVTSRRLRWPDDF
jgi:hypothetical protein